MHTYLMNEAHKLSRFLEAQHNTYEQALKEIQSGRKHSHWMWFIFPQVQGLGFTDTSKYYAIRSLEEAVQYLDHPVLGERLIEITSSLLALDSRDAYAIFGAPDELKLKSCMTLFSLAAGTVPIFQQVLDELFNGQKDQKTLQILGK